MSKLMLKILNLCCLVIICKVAFSQKTHFFDAKGDSQAIIIPKIYHIDTFYCIYNPQIPDEVREQNIFENQAYFWFHTDSLQKPKLVSKKEFAKNLLQPRSFYVLNSPFDILNFILPKISDSVLYNLLYQLYKDEDYRLGDKNDWYKATLSYSHNEKEQRYIVYATNSPYFLSIYMDAGEFNDMYNEVYNPPKYIFPEETKKDIVFIQFMIPVIGDDIFLWCEKQCNSSMSIDSTTFAPN